MPLPLVVIAGPTAAGKTSCAIAVAQALDGEIVSADSRQVYRGLDIGTAKASVGERAAAPHHLIDVVEPDQGFDAGRFVDLARQAITEIDERGRLPLVVGGTGLYLRALCGGLAPIAGRDQAVRARLEAQRRDQGNAALHARLAAVDPEAAERIPAADAVRLIRALEVFELTGQAMTQLQRAHGFRDRPYRVLWIVVDREREVLNERILRRARSMFDAGLVDEAVALRDRFGATSLLDTLGYREALALADGILSQAEAIERTAARTRRYAKRQRTWLRKEPVDHWLTAPTTEEVLEAVTKSSILADRRGV